MAKYFETNDKYSYIFDFTGKKVKKQLVLNSDTPQYSRVFVQTKWDMACDIDKMNSHRNMTVCYDHFNYDEIAEILVYELEKGNFDNVTIYQ